MKKKFTFIFIISFIIAFSFSQNITHKLLYRSGVYGQTFELAEYTDGDKCQLLLYMNDNQTKQVTTYDPSMETVYCIWSKWYSTPGEYSKAIEASKHFFDSDLNYVYLSDMKDICDIAPCCKSKDYRVKEWQKSKRKYIYIEYECSDLELLFEIARLYNAKGRDYVLQNYKK